MSLLLAPEWYLVVLGLAVLTALGVLWPPLLLLLPLLILAMTPQLIYALARGVRVARDQHPTSPWQALGTCLLTAFFQVMQPLVRLIGRLRGGLTPWRRRGGSRLAFPSRRSMMVWREKYQAPEARLETLEFYLAAEGAAFRRGGVFDRWDLEIRGGTFGAARLIQATEEHGRGRQMIRLRCWPRYPALAIFAILFLTALAAAAAMQQAWFAVAFLGIMMLLLAVRIFRDGAVATAICLDLFDKVRNERP